MKKIIAMTMAAMAVLAVAVSVLMMGTTDTDAKSGYSTSNLNYIESAETSSDRFVLAELPSGYDSILVRGVVVNWDTSALGSWDLSIGTIVTDSSTTGVAEIFYSLPISGAQSWWGDEVVIFPAPGINIEVAAGSTSGTVAGVTSGVLDSSSDWSTDATTVDCAGGSTCAPEPGDIVVIATENGGSATLDFSISLIYDAIK